jgi:hypothetical protein
MLTDTKLRTLKAKAKLYRVADTNGLCIEVRTNGARIWRYRYRYAGKASLLGLGNYPTVGAVFSYHPFNSGDLSVSERAGD